MTSTIDKGKGWIHGYAIALKNAAKQVNWGPYNTDETSLSNSLNDSILLKYNLDGYTNTQKLLQAHGTLTNYPAFYYALTDYNNKHPAPPTSSGWYLPSSGQWFQLAKNLSELGASDAANFTLQTITTSSTSPAETGYADQWTRKTTTTPFYSTAGYLNSWLGRNLNSSLYDPYADGTWFWDSTEASGYSGGIFQLYSSTITILQRTLKNSGSGDPNGGYVRPVLAF